VQRPRSIHCVQRGEARSARRAQSSGLRKQAGPPCVPGLPACFPSARRRLSKACNLNHAEQAKRDTPAPVNPSAPAKQPRKGKEKKKTKHKERRLSRSVAAAALARLLRYSPRDRCLAVACEAMTLFNRASRFLPTRANSVSACVCGGHRDACQAKPAVIRHQNRLRHTGVAVVAPYGARIPVER
jgi:hypothetical protein